MQNRLRLLSAFLLAGMALPLRAGPLTLARDGATDTVIVVADAAAVDRYAAEQLALYLGRITDAEFAVRPSAELAPDARALFVGLSASALARLGESDPLEGLADQEHVWRSQGPDLFLYGKGIHGNLYAVVAFLEEELGWRWVSHSEDPVFTKTQNLTLDPFSRRRRFSFAYRQTAWQKQFDYLHGINMGFSEGDWRRQRKAQAPLFPEGVESALFNPEFVHATYNYIPATPKHRFVREQYEWVENRNYFATNPEYFSMNKAGQRTSDILYCFSNPGLRAELTQHVLEHLRHLRKDVGEDVLLTLDTQDGGGKLCYCGECAALEEKYGTPGGPLFDYLFELCDRIRDDFPRARIKTGASRPEKTRIPPRLPQGRMFPDNLIVVFANLGDRVDRDWSHPDNRPNYEALQAWLAVTPHVWTWYYPNPYGRGGDLPFAGVHRLVADLRRMCAAGVEGVFQEFTTSNVHRNEGFVELQKYLYYKLCQDIGRDEAALIREFTDLYYGPAAALARRYLAELEEAHQQSEAPLPLTPVHVEFERTFAYLTPERIRRWQGLFDEMESVAADAARPLENVRNLRRTVDLATLARWHELVAVDPEYFTDYRVHKKRAEAVPWGRPQRNQLIADFETRIRAGGMARPLPPPFDAMDPARVLRFVPVNYRNASGPKVVLDEKAAFGYAATVDDPDLPFRFGYHPREEQSASQTVTRALVLDEIRSAEWQLYKLGSITVTPKGILWFSGKSWMTHLLVGERVYAPPAPGNDNRYEVHVSLKFDGPLYGGKAVDDGVLCDQILLVKIPEGDASSQAPGPLFIGKADR